MSYPNCRLFVFTWIIYSTVILWIIYWRHLLKCSNFSQKMKGVNSQNVYKRFQTWLINYSLYNIFLLRSILSLMRKWFLRISSLLKETQKEINGGSKMILPTCIHICNLSKRLISSISQLCLYFFYCWS